VATAAENRLSFRARGYQRDALSTQVERKP
jgi:hypothetical protein